VSYSIGIDIGGTRTKCLAADASGNILRRHAYDTGDIAEAWKSHIPAFLAETEDTLGASAGVGIAAPGIAAASARTIFWMRGRMRAVENFDFASLAPGRNVRVANDAQAALLGERWVGAARGCDNCILLTLGTGVGGAAVVDGRLLRGHLGRAGHLGHVTIDASGPPDICNTPGSIESAIGDHTVSTRSAGRFPSTADLVSAVLDDDDHAIRIWLDSVRHLAAAIASLINVLDPQVVLLAGGITRGGDTLLMPLRQQLDRFEWRPHDHRVELKLATLGDEAGALGAASLIMEP
jgi:glucokinase